MVYRGRFAPSPTGALHLGTARTALVAWLRARVFEGRFVLRVEDLDTPRVVQGSADSMMEDLLWLGMDWDEGPFYQSERTSFYAAAIRQLKNSELTYPCVCTRKDLTALASAPHQISEEGPIYPGTCRGRTHTSARAASTRFAMPEHEVVFEDGLHQRVEVPCMGDFVVQRADGVFAYQLAVVVDDIDMGITEVVRGADLLTSTARQIKLYEALKHPYPSFFHVPLLHNEAGQRLSKRDQALAVAALRTKGLSSDHVIGNLAWSLGLIPHPEPISASGLVEKLRLEPELFMHIAAAAQTLPLH